MELKEGVVLEQLTSDAIEMDLEGHTEDINPHIEHWLVKDITTNYYVLYNLEKGYNWKVKKENMGFFLKGNKKWDIKPLLTISKEVA